MNQPIKNKGGEDVKKLLITGFEPFGGENINPSWEAVSRLQESIKEYEINKLLVPVVFGDAAESVIKAAEKIRPDVIIAVDQAGGRDAVTPELVGINLRYAEIPDNNGNQPKDEPIKVGDETLGYLTILTTNSY